jgi:hypothetical protein
MQVDQTSLYRSLLKQERDGLQISGGKATPDPSRILSKAPSPFMREFSHLVSLIVSELYSFSSFLDEHSADYASASAPFSSARRMSASECDEIDREAKEYLGGCGKDLGKLKGLLKKQEREKGSDWAGHENTVVAVLQRLLKVCVVALHCT